MFKEVHKNDAEMDVELNCLIGVKISIVNYS
jgi:hypothetical protein